MNLIKPRVNILFAILLLAAHSVSAQKHADTKNATATPGMVGSADPATEQYKKTYDIAMKYGDYSSATQSVYGMLSADTGNLGLKDTLANLFFARGLYQQCILLANEIYKKQPGNDRVLELLAVSEQSLGNDKEALDYYEKLYSEKKQLSYLYQMVVLQFDMKRIGECSESIETIINNPDAEKEKVMINVGQGYQQSVPYKAAALNIKGVIANELKDTATAKKCFEDALKIYPDFAIAENNLQNMDKVAGVESEKNKTTTTNNKK